MSIEGKEAGQRAYALRHEKLLLSRAGGCQCAGLSVGLATGGGAVFCIRDWNVNPFAKAKDWSESPTGR